MAPPPAGGVKRPAPSGALARLAGYGQDTLFGLPEDAVEGASGCGTPVAFSDLLPGEVVLIPGAGAGLDLLLAARRVGPAGRVIGVEEDEALIERARANAARAAFENVELRQGTSMALPVSDASVDWVIGNRAIGGGPDRRRAFAEIRRVLRPGGRVCYAEIVAEGLPAWVRTGGWSWLSWVATATNESEHIAGLTEAGLEDVRDGGRYVYSISELTAIAQSIGDRPPSASMAAGFASEAVGGVWSTYFFARNPLSYDEGTVRNQKEELK